MAALNQQSDMSGLPACLRRSGSADSTFLTEVPCSGAAYVSGSCLNRTRVLKSVGAIRGEATSGNSAPRAHFWTKRCGAAALCTLIMTKAITTSWVVVPCMGHRPLTET